MSNLNLESVLDVRHWTEDLFSFKVTRDSAFRFVNGQFTMIGIEIDGKPLMRAYSMASANHEEHLEFFSIKVADGALTSRIQHLAKGDPILVGRKPTGTLIQDNLLPGKTLYLLSTGTGLAPFMSIVKGPEIYERFESIVLVHGCRKISELSYGETVIAELQEDEFLGDFARNQLVYYPTVTREPFRNRGRITDLIASGKLFDDLRRPPLNVENDRLMLCGSPSMLADLQACLKRKDFSEGNHSEPGHYVIEKAFVEK